MARAKFGGRMGEGRLRRALAERAARLMAEEGIGSFLIAKQKAAERLGVSGIGQLPDNAEVEAALASYQRLFQGPAQASRLHQQRLAALAAMERLSEFRPRLTGPVLIGTATAHVPATLHVFCETAEELAVWLHERGIPFTLAERRVRIGDSEYVDLPCYAFVANDVALDILVFAGKQQRMLPRSPVDGKPTWRASAVELRELLGAGPTSLLFPRDTAA